MGLFQGWERHQWLSLLFYIHCRCSKMGNDKNRCPYRRWFGKGDLQKHTGCGQIICQVPFQKHSGTDPFHSWAIYGQQEWMLCVGLPEISDNSISWILSSRKRLFSFKDLTRQIPQLQPVRWWCNCCNTRSCRFVSDSMVLLFSSLPLYICVLV